MNCHRVRRSIAVALLVLPLSPLPPMAKTAAPDLAVDGARWQIVNDGVMGGVSNSEVSAQADGVHFSGTVRTEYNGGFASVRRAVDAAALGAADGFVLRAQGDGHRYRLTVYVQAPGGGLQPYSYYAEFATTDGAVTEHRLPLAQFRATFRGRAVPQAPDLRAADVAGVGLMLTKDGHRDGRGPFALTLLSLRAAP